MKYSILKFVWFVEGEIKQPFFSAVEFQKKCSLEFKEIIAFRMKSVLFITGSPPAWVLAMLDSKETHCFETPSVLIKVLPQVTNLLKRRMKYNQKNKQKISILLQMFFNK